MASRPGERCSEGKCPLSPPARSQPPFHPRSMIIGCEHVALAQHDRDVSPHTVTIKGFGGQSAPKRLNTPEAVHLARQAFELGHGVEDLLSLAGVLCGSSAVPSRVAWSHATGGTKTAAGMEEGTAARRARGRPEPVGRSVSPKPVSANPVRKERHLFSFAERATPRINDGAAHSRSQPRANADVSAEASSLRCSLAPSATTEVAPRRGFARAGLAPVVLKPRRRGRGPTRLLSPGTDRSQLGRHR